MTGGEEVFAQLVEVDVKDGAGEGSGGLREEVVKFEGGVFAADFLIFEYNLLSKHPTHPIHKLPSDPLHPFPLLI